MAISARTSGVDELLLRQDGVVSTAELREFVSAGQLRWLVESRRWQRPAAGILVAHSGPLTPRQRMLVDAYRAGPRAVLAGTSAAIEAGLRWPAPRRTQFLVPAGHWVRDVRGLELHCAVDIAADVRPGSRPARVELPRGLIDAAAWASGAAEARAVLAAGVQQRLVRPSDLLAVVHRRPRLRRRRLVLVTLWDVEGGAHALSELDFARLVRRHRLPAPQRQAVRLDRYGHRRWLDAFWPAYHLVVEIDGMWHMEPEAWWDDMWRANELGVAGDTVLRYPSFAVRDDDLRVADQLRRMLRHQGWSG